MTSQLMSARAWGIGERATATPPGATPLLVVLYPLAVPYYLLGTRRGWWRGVALLWFVGFVVLAVLVQELAVLAMSSLVT